MSTLRHVDGTDRSLLIAQTGFDIEDSAIAALVAGGLLIAEGDTLRLADDGWPLADGITWRLCEALTPARAPAPGSA